MIGDDERGELLEVDLQPGEPMSPEEMLEQTAEIGRYYREKVGQAIRTYPYPTLLPKLEAVFKDKTDYELGAMIQIITICAGVTEKMTGMWNLVLLFKLLQGENLEKLQEAALQARKDREEEEVTN